MDNKYQSITRPLFLLLSWTAVFFVASVVFLSGIPKEIEIFSDETKVLSLPLKDVVIKVLPEPRLIPGGQSVGVKMDVKGVLVVGLEEIKTKNGQTINPGLTAGLEIGDSILSINETKVDSANEVKTVINEIRGQVRLQVNRKGEILRINLTPVQSVEDNSYKIGVWVRDKTAGLGTLTFFDPETNTFGALGHAITDPDTGDVLSVRQGELLSASVESIKQGEVGRPGEIRGIFYEEDLPLGKLEKNSVFGIFGKTYQGIENAYYSSPIPIGYQNEIKTGPAYILATLDGNKIEKYSIHIDKINKQNKPGAKGLILRVTDEKLLGRTGGIIQGMSGSPIIQNNKIIGAVTHVFINDPTRGYGIFIEWMLKQSGS